MAGEMKKYNVIYADPPWSYKGQIFGRGGTDKHYNTERIIDLKSLPVANLAANNCALFMWATFPLLQEAIDLGKHWGFTYKTVAFTWVKKNKKSDSPFIGMGYYTRANAEIVMLFTKGNAIERVNKNISQVCFEDEVFYSEIGKHSQKPDEIRKRIVKLFGDVPKVELFARSRKGMFSDYEYDGWDVYGNEVNNSIVLT